MTRHTVHRLRAASLALLLAWPALAEKAEKPAVDPLVALDIELDLNHIVFEVEIPELGTITAILDTGAGNTIFNTSTLDRLGIPYSNAGQALSASGVVALVKAEKPITVRLGELALELDGIGIDLGDLSRAVGHPVDCILGVDVFTRYTIEIDYQAGRLAVHDPETFVPRPGAHVVPLSDRNHGMTGLEARLTTVDGRRIEGYFILDTGAGPSLVLSPKFAEQHGLPATTAGKTVEITAHGAGQRFTNTAARLASVELAGKSVVQPVMVVSQAKGGVFGNLDIAGVIGGGLLKRFTATVDFPGKRLLLEPNDGFAEPEEMVSAGITLGTLETFSEFVVRDVIADSPAAEAGVEEGDRLVRVDDRPAASFTMRELRAMMEEEGSELRLQLARGEEAVTAVLKPRRLL